MTDTVFQKFEEKLVILLQELETLRNELNLLKLENATLKADKANSIKKLQGLISLLDSPHASHSSLDANQLEILSG